MGNVAPAQKDPQWGTPAPFGILHTKNMLVCDFLPEKGGWQKAQIVPFGPFSLMPNNLVFHYGQTVFEGLKAYRNLVHKNQVQLFRPEMNAKRMYRSAIRMAAEPYPEELFVKDIKEFVQSEQAEVPEYPGTLYLRPTLIPMDEVLSAQPAKKYRYFVIGSPAYRYFTKESVISLYIERQSSRVAPFGCGEAKCGGNYAASFQSVVKAQQLGADQVLWLDAISHQYVEEAGTMNIMCVYGDKIITPPLTGTILAGVTRDSILSIAQDLNFEIEERPIPIDELIADAKSGKLTEMFACGTAVVISEIGTLIDGDEKIPISKVSRGKPTSVSVQIEKHLTGIQFGKIQDQYNWITKI